MRSIGTPAALEWRRRLAVARVGEGYSIVEVADLRLIKAQYRLVCGTNSRVGLTIVRIDGSGKRDALAYAFRAISKENQHGYSTNARA